MYLPLELINEIYSFMPPHPITLLIRQSIDAYEMLKKSTNICYKFESYYLSTLFGYKQFVNNKKFTKEIKKFEPQSKIVREKRDLEYIDGIVRYNDDDTRLYLEYIDATKIINCYTSFVYDIQHSLEYCGMINEEYYHRLFVNEYYREYYEKWYNKYRNEIYNENRILKQRPIDIDVDGFNDKYYLRCANDCLNKPIE